MNIKTIKPHKIEEVNNKYLLLYKNSHYSFNQLNENYICKNIYFLEKENFCQFLKSNINYHDINNNALKYKIIFGKTKNELEINIYEQKIQYKYKYNLKYQDNILNSKFTYTCFIYVDYIISPIISPDIKRIIKSNDLFNIAQINKTMSHNATRIRKCILIKEFAFYFHDDAVFKLLPHICKVVYDNKDCTIINGGSKKIIDIVKSKFGILLSTESADAKLNFDELMKIPIWAF